MKESEVIKVIKAWEFYEQKISSIHNKFLSFIVRKKLQQVPGVVAALFRKDLTASLKLVNFSRTSTSCMSQKAFFKHVASSLKL
jgi:hypothetical protein